MIAKNFRRYADALLHQLELPFDALRTVQALSRGDFARLLRAAGRGLLDRSRWMAPIRRASVRKNIDAVIWTQLKLWLYTADQVELLLF